MIPFIQVIGDFIGGLFSMPVPGLAPITFGGLVIFGIVMGSVTLLIKGGQKD